VAGTKTEAIFRVIIFQPKTKPCRYFLYNNITAVMRAMEEKRRIVRGSNVVSKKLRRLTRKEGSE
jgi:hypothetical protein